jgi:hypothetical protein
MIHNPSVIALEVHVLSEVEGKQSPRWRMGLLRHLNGHIMTQPAAWVHDDTNPKEYF